MSSATAQSSRKPRKQRRVYQIQKPNGQLSPRVQAVGPERFGIVAIDVAKKRSRLLLANFYGTVLMPPCTVEHERGTLSAAIDKVHALIREHDLRDVVVAIERTGDYHRPIQRAFAAAGFETRIVHPLTTKQFRLPADPGNKTDDTDLAAIVRAVTQGFGLLEPVWPDLYVKIQLLRRHRRDLVDKSTLVENQIRATLHAAMPGFEATFTHLWQCPAALAIARVHSSAADILNAGADGLRTLLKEAGVAPRDETISRVLDWARNAPQGHHLGDIQRRIFKALDDDRREKARQIAALEVDLAGLAVQTTYALSLAIPGVNLVTVADLAGEMGPIQFYADAGCITGRAGLVPSRYQSDRVDCSGPLVKRANRRLRAVLMQTATNLVHCNNTYKARAEAWRRQRKDDRWIRVKIAKSFSRLLFAMVAGRQIFPHPALQPRHYVMGKLLEFLTQHKATPDILRAHLEALCDQLPARARAAEAPPLHERLHEITSRRAHGPRPLAEILPIVLARLQVIESTPRSEDPS
jgi:transposase